MRIWINLILRNVNHGATIYKVEAINDNHFIFHWIHRRIWLGSRFVFSSSLLVINLYILYAKSIKYVSYLFYFIVIITMKFPIKFIYYYFYNCITVNDFSRLSHLTVVHVSFVCFLIAGLRCEKFIKLNKQRFQTVSYGRN